MRERKEAIEYCLTLGNAYEDYPFDDANWSVMRHRENKKTFALIFERQGIMLIYGCKSPCFPQIIRIRSIGILSFWTEAFPRKIFAE